MKIVMADDLPVEIMAEYKFILCQICQKKYTFGKV
jgi:hypothetical protein